MAHSRIVLASFVLLARATIADPLNWWLDGESPVAEFMLGPAWQVGHVESSGASVSRCCKFARQFVGTRGRIAGCVVISEGESGIALQVCIARSRPTVL